MKKLREAIVERVLEEIACQASGLQYAVDVNDVAGMAGTPKDREMRKVLEGLDNCYGYLEWNRQLRDVATSCLYMLRNRKVLAAA